MADNVHEGNLNLSDVTSPEGLELPDKVTGKLNLYGLTSAEGLKLPEHVSGSLFLDSLTSAEGLKLPEHVGGELWLGRLTSADEVTFPEHVGRDLNLASLTSAEGLKLPKRVGGRLILIGLTSAEGLKLPKRVGGTLRLDGLTTAEGLKLPAHVGGDIHLWSLNPDEYDREIHGPEHLGGEVHSEPIAIVHEGDLILWDVASPEGLELPDRVTRDLYLGHLKSAEGLKFPEHVGGGLNLGGLTSVEGLNLPEHVGGQLNLGGLTSAEGLNLPEYVGRDLNLSGLTSAEGLNLPEHVGGYLNLDGLTSAEGLKLPEHVSRELNLDGLTSAEGLNLPEHVGRDLWLRGLTSAEGLKLPKHVGGEVRLDGVRVPEISRKEIPEDQTYYIKFKAQTTVVETVAGFVNYFDQFLNAIRNHSSWQEYVMSHYDFYRFDDIYHHYGTADIADTLVHPDGTEEPLRVCTVKEDENSDGDGIAGNPDNYGSFGKFLAAHSYKMSLSEYDVETKGPLIHVAESHEKGTWKTYELSRAVLVDEYNLEKGEDIDFGRLEAINAAGVITRYFYDDDYEYELPNDGLVSTETSNTQCRLYIACSKQAELLDFDAMKEDLLRMKLDISNDEHVRTYLGKTFGIETHTEWFE